MFSGRLLAHSPIVLMDHAMLLQMWGLLLNASYDYVYMSLSADASPLAVEPNMPILLTPNFCLSSDRCFYLSFISSRAISNAMPSGGRAIRGMGQ